MRSCDVISGAVMSGDDKSTAASSFSREAAQVQASSFCAV